MQAQFEIVKREVRAAVAGLIRDGYEFDTVFGREFVRQGIKDAMTGKTYVDYTVIVTATRAGARTDFVITRIGDAGAMPALIAFVESLCFGFGGVQ